MMEAMNSQSQDKSTVVIELSGVKKRFGRQMVLRGVDLVVHEGRTLVIVGASGQGKSVIIKHMLGLISPTRGTVKVFGRDLRRLKRRELNEIRSNFGVLFQNSALFDSLSVFDNVALPLRERTELSDDVIHDKVMEKLTLMDLEKAVAKFPAQLSGGMRKRAALARAIALDPQILFFDEPSAGLDPISSRLLDDLILQLKESIGATVVMVTHELESIFAIATNSVYLDASSRTMIDYGDPRQLRDRSEQPVVRQFLARSAGAGEDQDSE
jgi:phospholipid/cholesterol/gamma-HCH transport system ATP-binding protein